MKIGVSLPVFTDDVSRPLTVAAQARAANLDGVFAPDHLFPPTFYPPSGPGRPALETFSVLSAVAAREPGLAVGTLVARVTLRETGLLAKQGAALDTMSGAGAILALGTGDRASLPEHERYGIPFPSAAERVELLEETVEALTALFAGRAYPGGARVPAIAGPLLPPGAPQVWVGGLSDAVIGVAARVADAWNGWGLDAAGFLRKVTLLRELANGRAVDPTWGGIALVGRDAGELERLRREREARGLPLDGVWIGTADELRRFAAELEAAGASWFIVLPVGPSDRLELIAQALSSR